MLDRLLSMEIFVGVVELGSFTAAANHFKMSTPMVTKHIQELEFRLGTSLLARTTRRQHLTEVGQKYYESCKEILGSIKLAESGAEEMGSSAKGKLRVTASLWFGAISLAPVVADYLNKYKDVTIELSLTDRFVDIVDEGYDVAIRIGELADSSLIARKLSNFDVTICASPEYLNQYGTPTKPSELLNHQCLGFTNWRSSSGWKHIAKELSSKKGQTPRFESNNVQALRVAALKGLGIIKMPKDLLAEDLKQGRLIEILKSAIPPTRPIHAVYPREGQSVRKLTTFVDFLLERFKVQ
ncbi:MAG: LysR family transcriptional regulator [Pseudomonadota bacterium]